MKLKTMSGILGVVAAMWLCGGNLSAQDDNGGPGSPPPGGPGGNFDPAQFRQQMMEHIRKDLSVTNDEECA